MKTLCILLAGCALGGRLTVAADTPPSPAEPAAVVPSERPDTAPQRGPRWNRGPDAPPAEGETRESRLNSGPHGRAMDRWMEALKARNPQEFERLQKLQAENPQAFREELRERLMEARKRLIGKSGPQPQAVPGPQPQAGCGMMGEGGTRPAIVPRDFPPPVSPEGRAEWRQAEEQLRALARAWREATDAAIKQQKVAEIRTILAHLFDLRDKEQQAYLKAMEDRLAEVRARWDERRAKREDMIERRLQQIVAPAPAMPDAPAPNPPPAPMPPGAA